MADLTIEHVLNASIVYDRPIILPPITVKIDNMSAVLLLKFGT